MASQHTVRSGECISSISDTYGFFWETVWNDPNNAALKAEREDPNTLVPGDVVYIPDKRQRAEARQTGDEHQFKKRGIPAQLRLQLYDREQPRAHQDYVFVVDNEHRHTGTTDDEGVLKIPIAPSAKRGKLVIGPDQEEYEFEFGRLEPADTLIGVKTRLLNLGFYAGELDEKLDEETRAALLAFQARFDLEQTGDPDEATLEQLEQMHDEVADFPPDPGAQEAEEIVYEDET